MTEIQGRADSMMEEIKAREASININTDIYYILGKGVKVWSFVIRGGGGGGLG